MASADWTPAGGTATLVERVGADAAFELLTRLLVPLADPADYLRQPFVEVLRDIGDGHAVNLMGLDPTGSRLAYWPRSWAARALAYLADEAAADWLVEAASDAHWRVRMTVAQALGRLGAEGHDDALCSLLDDAHPRVRAAAATALGRTGGELALAALQGALDDAAETVRRSADRALARVEIRVREAAEPRSTAR